LLGATPDRPAPYMIEIHIEMATIKRDSGSSCGRDDTGRIDRANDKQRG
jgi:hypothetical protein